MEHDLIIRPEAEAELAEAFNWYEGQVPGLGVEFLNVVDVSLACIARNPNGFPLVHKTVRRCLTRGFRMQYSICWNRAELLCFPSFTSDVIQKDGRGEGSSSTNDYK